MPGHSALEDPEESEKQRSQDYQTPSWLPLDTGSGLSSLTTPFPNIFLASKPILIQLFHTPSHLHDVSGNNVTALILCTDLRSARGDPSHLGFIFLQSSMASLHSSPGGIG